MVETEQIAKEEKRKIENRRQNMDRRNSNIPNKILNYNNPDRRSGKEKRIKYAR